MLYIHLAVKTVVCMCVHYVLQFPLTQAVFEGNSQRLMDLLNQFEDVNTQVCLCYSNATSIVVVCEFVYIRSYVEFGQAYCSRVAGPIHLPLKIVLSVFNHKSKQFLC